MKILGVVLSFLLSVSFVPAFAADARSFDFTNESSNALVQKAWGSLDAKDLEGVEAYVARINQDYAVKAAAMQASLQDYASGTNAQIFKYWALNDVSTANFILGKAYRAVGNNDEAIKAFNRVINEFSFGQCWDTKGWFWKPAEAAKEQVALIQSGSNVDFGDYTSSTLVQKAWAALTAKDLSSVEIYVNKANELYSGKAKDMQASLQTFATGSNDNIFKYWALNDVGTAWFILGQAYQNAGKNDQAARAYKKVINEYSFAQCWDPQGFFWNPTEAAQQKLVEVTIN